MAYYNPSGIRCYSKSEEYLNELTSAQVILNDTPWIYFRKRYKLKKIVKFWNMKFNEIIFKTKQDD